MLFTPVAEPMLCTVMAAVAEAKRAHSTKGRPRHKAEMKPAAKLSPAPVVSTGLT